MEKYILRCIQLAKNGLGTTFPNPMVGCVIVHNDSIIGEGYTSSYGGNHAEVNAIGAVTDKSLLREATLYVTLEPCSHHGKTPPCADLIVKHRIPNIVIGTRDPHDKVAGRGIKMLKEAGCKVTVGVLENECKEHHKRFLTYHKKRRPFIVLKWAETMDGYIAPEKNRRKPEAQPYWITNAYSRQLVHKWRSEEQAILVGANTVLEDNPKLNVRNWHGNSPIRVILDQNLILQGNYHVLDHSIKTIIITKHDHIPQGNTGIYYEGIDFTKNITLQVCNALFKHNILSVLVEGGATTLQTFIEENAWDEARVFTGSSSFINGLKAPNLSNKTTRSIAVGSDMLNIYLND